MTDDDAPKRPTGWNDDGALLSQAAYARRLNDYIDHLEAKCERLEREVNEWTEKAVEQTLEKDRLQKENAELRQQVERLEDRWDRVRRIDQHHIEMEIDAEAAAREQK